MLPSRSLRLVVGIDGLATGPMATAARTFDTQAFLEDEGEVETPAAREVELESQGGYKKESYVRKLLRDRSNK